MSRRYAPDHKSLVLKLLALYKGDVAATSHYTGVPERTLRDWLNELSPAARSRLVAGLANSSKRRL